MLEQTLIQRNLPEGWKHRLFRLYHNLVQHFSVDQKVYYIFLVLEIIQLVNYACHQSFQRMWPGSPMPYIQVVLSFSDFSSIWKLTSTLLILFATINLLLNAVIAGLILFEVRKKIDTVEEPNLLIIKILGYYHVIIRTVLFIPLILAYTCWISPSNFNLSPTEIIVLGVISFLGLVFLALNTLLGLFFFRDNSPFSKREFSVSTNSIEELRLLIKVLLGIYGGVAQEEGQIISYSFGIIYLLLLLISVYMMMSRPGFLNYPFNRIYQLGLVLALWTLLNTFTQEILSPQESSGIIIWVLGLFIIPNGWSYLLRYIENSLLMTNYHSLRSPNQYLIYHFACIRMILRRNSPDRILILEGILAHHAQNCCKLADACVCSRLRRELLGRPMEPTREQSEREAKLWFQLVRQNLSEISDKYRRTVQIWFLLAFIENQIFENKFRSLHHLQAAEKNQGSIKCEFLNYHYKRIIEDKMMDQDKVENARKTMDINKFFKFQVGYQQLQQMIEDSAYKHAAFWEMLNSDKVTKTQLYQEGCSIKQHLQQIENQYELLMTFNRSNIHCMILYGNFMKVIANSSQAYEHSQENISAAKKFIAQTLKIQSDVEKEKYGENSITGIVIISGDRKNIGIIKYCTPKINDITGYVSHQLLGQNINVLMPKFIGNMHDDVLINYLELSRSQFDNIERIVPLIDANNYLILARVLTKPFPNLLNGLELIGIFNQIIESSPTHPEEKPKYVLYRSDSGQVQSLSESCADQFHYRINKIDEFHESSSQLTFNNLFVDLKESDIIAGKKVKCSVLSRCTGTSDFEAVSIDVYQRLHIFYYGINLRLLCFFTFKNYKQIVSAQEVEGGLEEQQSLLSKDDKLNTKHNQENKGKKEKLLHETGKKDHVLESQPLAFKLLKIWGFLFLILIILVAVILTVIHVGSNEVKDYSTIVSRQKEVIGHVSEVAFHGRLKHMTVFYSSDLPSLEYIKQRLSQWIDHLQKSEISLDESFLKYGTYDSLITKEYTYGTSKIVMSQNIKLNNHIFDYITVTSSLASLPVSDLNFNLQIMTVPSPTTGTTIMFKSRYNAIFEIIPWQIIFSSQYDKIFQELFIQQDLKVKLQLILSMIGLSLGMFLAMALTISVVKTTEGTLMLFGYISRFQVQKQMENCYSFLEIFYQDSYIVKLKERQLIRQKTMFEEPIARQLKSGISTPALATTSRMELQDAPSHNTIHTSVNRFEFLEKELHLRTQGELLMTNNEQDNEQMGLRDQPSSSGEEGSIYQKLNEESDGCKCRVVLIYLTLFILMCSFFVTEYILNSRYTADVRENVYHLQLAYDNLNSLKLMKLYSLQTYVDSSPFLTYPALKNTIDTIYSQFYEHQRKLDQITTGDHSLAIVSQYNYNNLCTIEAIQKLEKTANSLLTFSQSFSVQECSTLLGGILSQGIRLGMASYAQNYLKISRFNITEVNPSTIDLKELIAIQKYLQISFWDFISVHLQEISSSVVQKQKSLWTCLGVFMGLSSVLYLLFWLCTLTTLFQRLHNVRHILSFIPIRVFMHNNRLTKEYQLYLGEIIN